MFWEIRIHPGGGHFTEEEAIERTHAEPPVPSLMMVTALHMGEVSYDSVKDMVVNTNLRINSDRSKSAGFMV